MKIIYGLNEKNPAKKCIAVDKEGNEFIIGCYDIKIEMMKDSKAGEQAHFSRWGKISERKEIHKKIADFI